MDIAKSEDAENQNSILLSSAQFEKAANARLQVYMPKPIWLLTFSLCPKSHTLNKGSPKKTFFLGQSSKQRTPPIHPAGLGLPKVKKIHEKIICLEWSNMPYKHGMYLHWKV